VYAMKGTRAIKPRSMDGARIPPPVLDIAVLDIELGFDGTTVTSPPLVKFLPRQTPAHASTTSPQ
jgi:hypothetical protein